MSNRFRNELFFLAATIVWIVALVVTCVFSHWYWFIVGWVVLAFLSAAAEFFTYKRRIVAHWERIPLWYNFLVHLYTPLLMFVMVPRLPQDYREWKATPKPRHRNYNYPRSR